MPIRDEAINVFMGLPGDGARLELTYNHGVDSLRARHRLQPHRGHRRRPRRQARRARRAGHRAREAAVPGARGRLADLLRARPGRLPGRADRGLSRRRTLARRGRAPRIAVVDLGSNSFRLVVFTAGDGWWKRTDEIYEAVRIGEGADEIGGARRASRCSARSTTLELFAHFCRARRASTRSTRWRRARSAARRTARSSWRKAREHARRPRAERGGGGALRLPRRGELDDAGRRRGARPRRRLAAARPGRRSARPQELRSWPLGAVRMTERFLPDDEPAPKKQLKALRAHVAAGARGRAVAGRERRAASSGSAARSATSPSRRRSRPACRRSASRASCSTREALDDLVDRLAALPPSERAKVPGIKPARADLILAGAATIQAVLEAGGFDGRRGHRGGPARGRLLRAPPRADRPVRRRARRERAQPRRAVRRPTTAARRARRASWRSRCSTTSPRRACIRGDPVERELLWAAAMLHDIGVAVDYDDHHKHSRYLILNAGLPGYSQREIALDRADRPLPPQGHAGARRHRRRWRARATAELVARCAALLRLAEQLERSRDQLVRAAHVAGGRTARSSCGWRASGDVSLARWAAQRQGERRSSARSRSA